MKTIRILGFLLTAAASRAQTPELAVSLADTQQRTLKSAKIGQRYELLVSLPAGYAKSGESYPVLYVLDGWHVPLMGGWRRGAQQLRAAEEAANGPCRQPLCPEDTARRQS